MRLTQIEDMLKDHEKRIKELEERKFVGVDIAKEKDKTVIAPIKSEEGIEQRDKAREKLLKKAEKENDKE